MIVHLKLHFPPWELTLSLVAEEGAASDTSAVAVVVANIVVCTSEYLSDPTKQVSVLTTERLKWSSTLNV